MFESAGTWFIQGFRPSSYSIFKHASSMGWLLTPLIGRQRWEDHELHHCQCKQQVELAVFIDVTLIILRKSTWTSVRWTKTPEFITCIHHVCSWPWWIDCQGLKLSRLFIFSSIPQTLNALWPHWETFWRYGLQTGQQHGKVFYEVSKRQYGWASWRRWHHRVCFDEPKPQKKKRQNRPPKKKHTKKKTMALNIVLGPDIPENPLFFCFSSRFFGFWQS